MSKKKRKVNKKLQDIKKSNINIKISENEQYYYIDFNVDTIIEPAPRPRVNNYSGHIYEYFNNP